MNYPAPPSRSIRIHPLLLAGLWLLCAYTCAAAKPSFTVQPPPAWVQQIAPAPASTTKTNGAEGGVSYLLFDRQMHVTARGAEHYYRLVEQVSSAADVEKVSQLRLDFEPSYQQLVIHYIHVLRGGAVLDVLHPAEIKVIQQEDELDQQLFNGTLSALAVLEDVRPGDVIDYAYSVNGDNPVLAGQYADIFTLARPEPVAYMHARLLWPAARKLSLRALNTDVQPVVKQWGDEVEYLWERRDVPGAVYEDATPAWFDPVPVVQLSEFATWSDVVRWAAPLYQVPVKLSPALTTQIEKWRAELPQPEARLLAARRFVQDEVRYLGIELGPYSHTPTQPDKVFQRRFGDCKDKSMLLVTMLNALGIEAHPALVNTDARHALDTWQPSPYDFDHVIVQAQLNNQTYWLDPTISYQRGPLALATTPPFERALVLSPDTQALIAIPPTPLAQPTTEVHALYRIADFAAPVALTVTTIYRGEDADTMRYRLASESRADLGKDYLNYYADHEPSIEAQELPEIADDESTDTLTITEQYRIPRFWKEAAHTFLAERIGEELSKPNVSRRTMPLRVTHPTNVEQLIEIQLPHRQRVEVSDETVEDEALAFTAAVTTTDNVVKLHYTLRTKQGAVAAQDVARHLAIIDEARDLAGYELKQGPPVRAAGFSRLLDALFAICLLGVGLLVVYGWLKRRRAAARAFVNVAAHSRARARPGAQPETAIRLTTETEINRYVADVSCRGCGRRAPTPAAQQGLIYDDQRLIVVQLECDSCRHNQDMYFAPAI
jgi:transglutaminase-like putative cysteine protease